MRFICGKSDFSEAVNTVSKAVNTTAAVDILKGIKIEAGDHIKLTGSDMDFSIECIMPADVREEGSIVLDSRILTDIVRKLPDGDIEIFTGENNEIKIICKKTNFNLLYLSSESYPDINKIYEGDKFSMYSRDLKEIIKNTLFAISKSDARPILKGSKFEIEKSSLKVVSIDGTRLAIRNMIIPETNLNISFVVPGRVLDELLKVLKDDETIVNITVCDNTIMFAYDTFIITARLLEGEFFDYTKAIPKSADITAVIDVKKFISLVERAAIIENYDNAKEAKVSVILKLDNSMLNVECVSQKGLFSESIDVEHHGKSIRIGMDSKILLDALKNIEFDEALFEFTTEISPCVIKPTEGDAFLYMVLPKRLIN